VQPLTSDDPAKIGAYRLKARLGAGGMGRVYLAATPAGRPVAVKVVRSELSDDPDFRARFHQEIQAAQRVHGLYTAQLVDADPDATPPWLVTAYVPGPSLEEAIDSRGPMPEAMVFRLVAGVAEALQAIHAADVVHRDLKPSNVLLGQDGPRVIDFGIARALESTSLTRGDIMMGSPDFLSPELILDLPISPAVDVFALGSIAVFAATGRPPFGHGNVAAIAHRVVYEPPDLDGCPTQLLTLIEACLEKQAKDRPAPSRIIEFCAAHAAGMTDAGQPWLGWGLTDDPPDFARQATALTITIGDGTGGSAGVNGGGSADESTAGAEEAERKRVRRTAALAAVAALAAAAVIAIAVTSHPAAAGRAAARSTTSTPPAVAPTVPGTAGSTVRVPASATAHSPTPTSARRSAAPAPTPSKAPAPVVLLSQDHTVTASSIQGYPWAAADAVDGNLGTRWSSAWSDPQWLQVDLGAPHAIRRIVLYWENAHATAFKIQASVNGTTWTDLYSTTTGPGNEQSIQVSGTGRYVRMYGTARNTSYGYSLWEFQVFGS
jgi:hypothetical protein